MFKLWFAQRKLQKDRQRATELQEQLSRYSDSDLERALQFAIDHSEYGSLCYHFKLISFKTWEKILKTDLRLMTGINRELDRRSKE